MCESCKALCGNTASPEARRACARVKLLIIWQLSDAIPLKFELQASLLESVICLHLGQVAAAPVATPFLQVVKMVADGNCLLHALACEGALASADPGEALRLELIDFLSSHAAHQGPFEETWLEEAEYLQRGPESAWAGNVAILAFSLMARRRVRVHTRHPDFTVTEEDATHQDLQDEPNLPIVQVLYNGVDHYDLLLEIENDEGTEPAWEGQLLPARYVMRQGGEELQREDSSPPSKKARVGRQESETSEVDLIEDELDPTKAELEDVMDEVSRASVAATSDHPHRELEDAIKHLAEMRIHEKPTLPPLASSEDVDVGAAWPHTFCAFSGCMWTCQSGNESLGTQSPPKCGPYSFTFQALIIFATLKNTVEGLWLFRTMCETPQA